MERHRSVFVIICILLFAIMIAILLLGLLYQQRVSVSDWMA